MRIYFDVCCLNRPFDDQTQTRIHLETEAVESILLNVERGEWILVGSDTVTFEAGLAADPEHIAALSQLRECEGETVRVSARESNRAAELTRIGFKPLDALHLACAETAAVDVLLTTDDRFLKNALRHAKVLQVRVANPMGWLQEQLR